MLEKLIDFALIVGALNYATPTILGGVGGLFGERAGVVNIGLEGLMLTGAFAAATSAHFTGSPWIGLLVAIILSTLLSLLHAYFCIELQIDHVVSGLAINIFASNITIYLLSSIFNNKGSSPPVNVLPNISVNLLGRIPIIGQLFQEQSIITVTAILLTALAHFVLYKTKFGLHVLSVGENPKAAHVLGIDVKKIRYVSVMIGGACCGLAGAFLSISFLNFFSRNMTAGIGFIAIAAMIFGKWKPWGVAASGLFFGLANAVQMRLQGHPLFPGEFIQSIPYILTILVIAGIVGKAIPPAASGKHFNPSS